MQEQCGNSGCPAARSQQNLQNPLSYQGNIPSGDKRALSDRLNQNRNDLPPYAMADTTLAACEQHTIIKALRANRNNRTRTARALGIARTTLYKKLQKYSIT